MTSSKKRPVRRVKKRPSYQSFRLHKRIKATAYKPLPSSWKLIQQSARLLWNNKRKVLLFMAVVALLLIIFVRGLSGGVNLADLKFDLQEITGTQDDGLAVSILLFSNLIASTNATTSDVADMYQAIIIVIASMAFIWLMRQVSANRVEPFRLREAFYRGPQQLVPFLLVIMVVALTFVPFSIGSFLLTTASSAGIAGGELFAVAVIALLLALLSLYLASGYVMALFVVTLPGTNPMKALRTSTSITNLHRWSIVRKIIVFLILVLVLLATVFIPLLLVIPDGFEFIAEGLYFLGTIAVFCFGHAYLYSLYRSMI